MPTLPHESYQGRYNMSKTLFDQLMADAESLYAAGDLSNFEQRFAKALKNRPYWERYNELSDIRSKYYTEASRKFQKDMMSQSAMATQKLSEAGTIGGLGGTSLLNLIKEWSAGSQSRIGDITQDFRSDVFTKGQGLAQSTLGNITQIRSLDAQLTAQREQAKKDREAALWNSIIGGSLGLAATIATGDAAAPSLLSRLMSGGKKTSGSFDEFYSPYESPFSGYNFRGWR